MSAENIVKLADIGLLSVQLHAASLARKSAKSWLRDKYTEYCWEEGLCEERGTYVRPGQNGYDEMQAYAATEVKAYARAKLDEYNLKRKLDRAVRAYKEA